MSFVDPPFSYKKKRIRIDITLSPYISEKLKRYSERKCKPISYVIEDALEMYLKEVAPELFEEKGGEK